MKHYDHNPWAAIAAGALLVLAAGTAGAQVSATTPAATQANQTEQAERQHRHGAPGKGITHRLEHKSAAASDKEASPSESRKPRQRRSGPPGKSHTGVSR